MTIARSLLETGNQADVVLVVPPVINPGSPTLGTAVLAAACRGAGVKARVFHANVAFAAQIGFELCLRISASPPRNMLGEAIFWGAAFPDRAWDHPRIVNALAAAREPISQIQRLRFPEMDEIHGCIMKVPSFIAETAEKLLAFSPLIVGLSSMCQQTHASVAIAREIKRRRPDVITVLGGANAAEPMGSALLDVTGDFDFVFSGEADVAFPEFCRRYLMTGQLPSERVLRCAPIEDLNDAAIPDYADYYADIEPLRDKDPLAAQAPSWLVFESSRGCWWADKLNCAFCGFNGARFRTKTPERIVTELQELASRYSVRHMLASDTIMPRDLPSVVLPRVAQGRLGCSIAYPVKADLEEADLDNLARAGVSEIQPGIESLSTHILRLVSKGTKALDNVWLLRESASRGIHVVWNFLTSVPGEMRKDYDAMLTLLPLLEHLPPPTRWGPIRISRYSPYHRDPARYGIKALRPWSAYEEFYGIRAEHLARHFVGEYQTPFTGDPNLMARFGQTIRNWADAWLRPEGPPVLFMAKLEGGGVVVRDTRAAARACLHVLTPAMIATLELVRRPRSAQQLAESVRATLDCLVESGLVAHYENEFLALPYEHGLATDLKNSAICDQEH